MGARGPAGLQCFPRIDWLGGWGTWFTGPLLSAEQQQFERWWEGAQCSCGLCMKTFWPPALLRPPPAAAAPRRRGAGLPLQVLPGAGGHRQPQLYRRGRGGRREKKSLVQTPSRELLALADSSRCSLRRGLLAVLGLCMACSLGNATARMHWSRLHGRHNQSMSPKPGWLAAGLIYNFISDMHVANHENDAPAGNAGNEGAEGAGGESGPPAPSSALQRGWAQTAALHFDWPWNSPAPWACSPKSPGWAGGKELWRRCLNPKCGYHCTGHLLAPAAHRGREGGAQAGARGDGRGGPSTARVQAGGRPASGPPSFLSLEHAAQASLCWRRANSLARACRGTAGKEGGGCL